MAEKIILKISLYGQDTDGKEKETNDNDTTPGWAYDTVERISFVRGGKKEVTVPKVWVA